MSDESTADSGNTGTGDEGSQQTDDKTLLGGDAGDDGNGQGGAADDGKGGEGGEGDQGDNGGDGDGKPDGDGDGKGEGAPDEYKWEKPEGFEGELDEKALEEFEPIARELGLTQEQANQLVALQAQVSQRYQEAAQTQFAETQKQWMDDLKNDADFGGNNFDANVKLAQKGVNALGMPELKEALNETGMGKHPALVKAFAKVGRSISEDGFELGGQSTAPKTAAELMYGKD